MGAARRALLKQLRGGVVLADCLALLPFLPLLPRQSRPRLGPLEDDADDDLVASVHLVDDARPNALSIEELPDRELELVHQQVHDGVCTELMSRSRGRHASPP